MKKAISVIMALFIVFSCSTASIANAAAKFSFSGINLSTTPQKMIEIGHAESRAPYINTYYAGNSFLGQNFFGDTMRNKLKIPTTDIEYKAMMGYHSVNNDRLKIEYVSFLYKEGDCNATTYYITMPNFTQKAFFIHIDGSRAQDSRVQHVPDVFNKRYYNSNDVIYSNYNNILSIIWENGNEVAVYCTVPQSLYIFDRKLYSEIVNFFANEHEKIENKKREEKKAEAEARKNKI